MRLERPIDKAWAVERGFEVAGHPLGKGDKFDKKQVEAGLVDVLCRRVQAYVRLLCHWGVDSLFAPGYRTRCRVFTEAFVAYLDCCKVCRRASPSLSQACARRHYLAPPHCVKEFKVES